MSEKKKDTRSRTWTFIVYPDSAPENWRDILIDEHVEGAISPLHDKDINADGELKKEHWHVFISFEGKKSLSQVKEITDKFNSPIPQKCNSKKGIIRYFAHLDNPEKFQYDKKDIVGFGGLNVKEYLLSASEEKQNRYNAIKEMCQFVDDNNIFEFCDLMNYAMLNNDEWFELLCDNSAYVVGQYIKSKRHKSN